MCKIENVVQVSCWGKCEVFHMAGYFSRSVRRKDSSLRISAFILLKTRNCQT